MDEWLSDVLAKSEKWREFKARFVYSWSQMYGIKKHPV